MKKSKESKESEYMNSLTENYDFKDWIDWLGCSLEHEFYLENFYQIGIERLNDLQLSDGDIGNLDSLFQKLWKDYNSNEELPHDPKSFRHQTETLRYIIKLKKLFLEHKKMKLKIPKIFIPKYRH